MLLLNKYSEIINRRKSNKDIRKRGKSANGTTSTNNVEGEGPLQKNEKRQNVKQIETDQNEL